VTATRWGTDWLRPVRPCWWGQPPKRPALATNYPSVDDQSNRVVGWFFAGEKLVSLTVGYTDLLVLNLEKGVEAYTVLQSYDRERVCRFVLAVEEAPAKLFRQSGTVGQNRKSGVEQTDV
jgi:hypothetical protein